jgi:phosphatidylserine/phosphatidylglycerophosphate/cardiolipin synthase-like enzyme
MDQGNEVAIREPTTRKWLEELKQNAVQSFLDKPNYYINQPEQLITKARVHAFMNGSGAEIWEHLEASIESATDEVVLITCFWAPSESLRSLIKALRKLSDKVHQNGLAKIRVFIGFSSVSIWQKLFQTSSLEGKTYTDEEATSILGLPPASQLPGLELTIKCIFVRPFSVMHPKFLIIDRRLVWLPSCNVSWEVWFEGAIALSGSIVDNFIRFWEKFWFPGASGLPLEGGDVDPTSYVPSDLTASRPDIDLSSEVNAVFLPSPHHANPRFRPPFFKCAEAPATPLNVFQLVHVRSAVSSIFIETPNLTSSPVIAELVKALERGVNVRIVTAQRLMILEQLVTAGTTNGLAIKNLIRRYENIAAEPTAPNEAGLRPRGSLQIEYFIARPGHESTDPGQTHFKLAIFDDEVVVLGSQNMDRASWYTSQELGIAFVSQSVVRLVKSILEENLTAGRTQLRYQSG